ncbi:MAG: hypothetical protein ABJN69_15920 [Hellea sp.]
MRNVIKKLALTLPPVRKIHTDLENRRRRVAELEGHLKVLKKQMARALNSSSFASLSESTAASDMKYIKGERDKAIEQTKLITSKYDTLYRDFCVVSMSNEALLKTNDALMNGDLKPSGKPLINNAKSRKPASKRKVATPKKTTTVRARKTKTSSKARQA